MALRLMPWMEGRTKKRILKNMPSIAKKIIDEYERNNLISRLSEAINKKELNKAIEILLEHRAARLEILKLKKNGIEVERRNEMRLLKSFFSSLEKAEDEEKVKEVIKEYDEIMRLRLPKTYELIIDVIELKGQTPLLGPKARAKFAFIGDKNIDENAAICFVFSGGGAKGAFYMGFIKALTEEELWPDYVVGSSAGAIAAASMAYGNLEKIEKHINAKTISFCFSPITNAGTFFLSFGNGVIGYWLPKILNKAFGKTKIEDMADCFIITTVPPWRSNIIGCTSNDSICFSKNMPVAKAVWGSCSIPGIVPQPTETNAELNKIWFEGRELREARAKSSFIRLEDGNITQPLPIMTALGIARILKKKAFIIALNLNELDPIEGRVTQHFTLKEHVKIVKKEISFYEKEKKVFAGLKIALKGLWHWIKQQFSIFIQGIAPVRAMKANDALYVHNIINTLRNTPRILESGEAVLLINPNANGELEGIGLSDKNGMEKLASYGYKIGKEFASLLLLKNLKEENLKEEVIKE
ncbi:MAG: patatin-like phospholipase family protein [Candidatus Anstonellales archaeon]